MRIYLIAILNFGSADLSICIMTVSLKKLKAEENKKVIEQYEGSTFNLSFGSSCAFFKPPPDLVRLHRVI